MTYAGTLQLLTMMFALAMLMIAVAFAVWMLYDLIPKKHQSDMNAHLTHVYRQRKPSRTMGTEIKDRPKFGD